MDEKIVDGVVAPAVVVVPPVVKKEEVAGAPDPLKNVDPLAVGLKLKKVGAFVVQADYDETLSPAYKSLNDQHVELTRKIAAEREQTEITIRELQTQLSQNTTLAADEKSKISTKLDELETNLSITRKDAKAAQVELLKVQTAAVKALPYQYIKYVTGETAEEISQSIDLIAVDFKLQTNKISKEELDTAVAAAAETARLETEAALKNRGKNTEGGGAGDHIFTRSEILVMSITDYKAHRPEIERQQAEGLIK